MRKQNSFTLIELLVVIAIIGILAAIAIPSLSNVRAKARDARRLADLDQLAKAMELYFNDYNHYPIWESGCIDKETDNPLRTEIDPSSPVFFTDKYMKTPPKDPLPNKYCYYYQSDATGGNFKMAAYLEKDTARSSNDNGTETDYYEIYAGPTGRGSVIDIDDNALAQAMPGYQAVCGNNIIEGSEICDGTALASQTCESQIGTNYTGTLSCNTDCSAFVTSLCVYHIPQTGLVGYWKMDEGAGITTADSSPSSPSNTGYLYSGDLNCALPPTTDCPIWTSGASCKFGNCLNFDGQNDYLATQTITISMSSNTVAMWVWPFGNSRTEPNYYAGFGARVFTRYTATKLEWGAPNDLLTWADAITYNAWNHLVFAFDDSEKTITLYKNGVNLGTQSAPNTSFSDSGSYIFSNIGNYTGGHYPLNAKFDEIAIWNRALSAQEILEIYNHQK